MGVRSYAPCCFPAPFISISRLQSLCIALRHIVPAAFISPPLLNTSLISQRHGFLISLPPHVLPSVSIAAALQRPQPRCCPPSSVGTPTPSPPSHPPSLISPQTCVTCEEWTCSIDGNSVSYEVLRVVQPPASFRCLITPMSAPIAHHPPI